MRDERQRRLGFVGDHDGRSECLPAAPDPGAIAREIRAVGRGGARRAGAIVLSVVATVTGYAVGRVLGGVVVSAPVSQPVRQPIGTR